MTKKRFKKLLMGRFLYDRNAAEWFAKLAQLTHIMCRDAPEAVYQGAFDTMCKIREEEELQCK